jgi:hypothetical protein
MRGDERCPGQPKPAARNRVKLIASPAMAGSHADEDLMTRKRVGVLVGSSGEVAT